MEPSDWPMVAIWATGARALVTGAVPTMRPEAAREATASICVCRKKWMLGQCKTVNNNRLSSEGDGERMGMAAKHREMCFTALGAAAAARDEEAEQHSLLATRHNGAGDRVDPSRGGVARRVLRGLAVGRADRERAQWVPCRKSDLVDRGLGMPSWELS